MTPIILPSSCASRWNKNRELLLYRARGHPSVICQAKSKFNTTITAAGSQRIVLDRVLPPVRIWLKPVLLSSKIKALNLNVRFMSLKILIKQKHNIMDGLRGSLLHQYLSLSDHNCPCGLLTCHTSPKAAQWPYEQEDDVCVLKDFRLRIEGVNLLLLCSKINLMCSTQFRGTDCCKHKADQAYWRPPPLETQHICLCLFSEWWGGNMGCKT